MLSFIEKQFQEVDEESGESTWHIIAKNGDVEIIRNKYFDLDEAEINIKNTDGLTPFAIAFERNNLEMIKELMKFGAKNSNDDMSNFIITAIQQNNPGRIKELINCGVEISKDVIWSLVATAFHQNNPKILKEINKFGVEIPNQNLLKFFTNAVRTNNPEIVKELINFGIEISKDAMLNFIAISIKNGYSDMNNYLISIFEKKNNSEGGFQGVSSSDSSGELGQSIPSCEPSPVKKMRLTDYNSKSLS